MRILPVVLLLLVIGCGNAALVSTLLPAVDATSELGDRASQSDDCNPDRTLRLIIVTESASLVRDIPSTGLNAGAFVPALDVAPFGLDEDSRRELIQRIVTHTAERLSPFGVEVVSDAVEPERFDAMDEPPTVELISRIILTQVEGVPEHCGCQGSTGGLGLPDTGPAEGAVFVNAFVENGLEAALSRYPTETRVEKLAAALANSVLHEAGHTLGLVHVDVAGQPTLLMARGGSSAAKVSLAAITTLQSYSGETLPVTDDAVGVRETQCDACTIQATLGARRACQ